MPEDNIRGNIGGEAGFVLQDCQGDSIFYFIRKKSAIRIQKNWRHFNDKTAKTNTQVQGGYRQSLSFHQSRTSRDSEIHQQEMIFLIR